MPSAVRCYGFTGRLLPSVVSAMAAGPHHFPWQSMLCLAQARIGGTAAAEERGGGPAAMR